MVADMLGQQQLCMGKVVKRSRKCPEVGYLTAIKEFVILTKTRKKLWAYEAACSYAQPKKV